MIVPTTIDCLRLITSTFERHIKPTLTGHAERSAAATLSHLLRHISLRVEHEGRILFDDILRLRVLLDELRRYLARGEAAGTTKVVSQIENALQRRFREENRYPALHELNEEAGALREALNAALKLLQSDTPDAAALPGYNLVRENIRNYMAQQIRDEAVLIEPAFVGHGPRR